MNLINLLRDQIRNLLSSFITTEAIIDILIVAAMIIFWILFGFIVIKTVKIIVLKADHFKDKETKQGLTMRKLINNLIKALFFFWIGIMILNEIGIDILPILAGAGVVAFAVGFGAQELVKDLIGGFFLILEKTFSIGDTIEIEGRTGVVLDIGLRRTKIRNWKGEIITINNGDIKTVINSSINPSIAVIKFNLDFRTDVRLFETAEFNKFLVDFALNHEEIIGEANTFVVVGLQEGNVTLQTTFTTNIRKHIGVERDFMKAFLIYCNDHNIDLEIPLIIEENKHEQ